MAEDPVVMALRAALSSSEQAAIRVALGERLLTLGRAADALAELEAGLQHDPTDVAVLGAAAEAARQAGDVGKATAYDLALGALAGGESAPTPARPTPLGAVPADAGAADDADDYDPPDAEPPAAADDRYAPQRESASGVDSDRPFLRIFW